LPWVCDFRTLDVALGGNGAPLVPVGDAFLFSDYADSFLNLGGFSNISFQRKDKWSAFDICPVNLIFNFFANKNGLDFDKDGDLGKIGSLDDALFHQLNDLSFYHSSGPKSLGVEWLQNYFLPIVEDAKNEVDAICTIYHHVAFQISKVLIKNKLDSVFVTGGGAKNLFLIELIQKYFNGKVIIPDEVTVDFKEAIVFAFLGVLRLREEINIFASVTGASKDNMGGCIHIS